jgi:hypothetical protein
VGALATAASRIVILVVGVVCLVAGALLGWFAAHQGADTSGVAVSGNAGAAADVRAARQAASQAAIASEGWAHVSNGAYTLAKTQNDAAQTALKQAREYAARAEKAAARADAAEARMAKATVARAETADVASAAPAAKPRPSPRPRVSATPKAVAQVDEGCRRAIIYERTAARSAVSKRAAYNAVMSGFAMNAHCGEPQHSLNEAYLLAQRAAAESALNVGDWRADLGRSDELLARCTMRPEYRQTASGCRARLKKNQSIRQTIISRREPARRQ